MIIKTWYLYIVIIDLTNQMAILTIIAKFVHRLNFVQKVTGASVSSDKKLISKLESLKYRYPVQCVTGKFDGHPTFSSHKNFILDFLGN